MSSHSFQTYLAGTGTRKDSHRQKFSNSTKAKLGRREFFGSLDRTPNKTSKTNPLPVQLIKGPDGLQGGKKALETLSDILATTPRR